jgi:hypothetical protein
VDGKAREDRYVEAVRNRSLVQAGNPCIRAHTQKPDYKPRRDSPREFLSPLGINSGDVCTTLFPLGLPNLAAVERGTVEVRTSERIELRFGKVQRRPKLIGRRERVEIRCMDKRVVAIPARMLVQVRGRDSKEREKDR